MDPATLANIASIIAAFGAAMLTFRVQRELTMHDEGEPIWLPWADRLLILATCISLLLVIVPLVSVRYVSLPAAAAGSAAILVSGYVFAILAHYRIFWGKDRKGPRENPEPAERVITFITLVVATLFFCWRVAQT